MRCGSKETEEFEPYLCHNLGRQCLVDDARSFHVEKVSADEYEFLHGWMCLAKEDFVMAEHCVQGDDGGD